MAMAGKSRFSITKKGYFNIICYLFTSKIIFFNMKAEGKLWGPAGMVSTGTGES